MKILNLKWISILSLILFISCEENQKPTEKPEQQQISKADDENTQKPSPAETKDQTQETDIINDYLEEPDEKQSGFKCDIHNYKDYVQDFQKMNQLIAETGKGCYLPGIDFSGKDLTNLVFTKSYLNGAIFKNAVLNGTKFISADLTNAVLEDTNYMSAYFRNANLTGATYNEYSATTAWIKSFTGQGIRNPEGKGMRYVGD